MKKVGFWLAKCAAYLIAITPFSLLYLKADIWYFLICHMVRYRRKVVRDNLVKSFPEKPVQEIKRIEKRFYRNFCDLVVEICKSTRMKPEDVLKHVTITNPELLEDLYNKKKSVLLAMHHSSNWEWLWKVLFTTSSHRHFAVYKKLENPYFDRYIYQVRTSQSSDKEIMIQDRMTTQRLDQMKDSMNSVFILGDQSPRGSEKDYWTEFLHRDTCWYRGVGKLAQMYGYAVVYVEMVREGRGLYKVTFKTICEDPYSLSEDEIIEQYVRHVERFIQDNPDNWLWSHRRWKHKKPQA